MAIDSESPVTGGRHVAGQDGDVRGGVKSLPDEGDVCPMGSTESDLELHDLESGDGLRLSGDEMSSVILSDVGILTS